MNNLFAARALATRILPGRRRYLPRQTAAAGSLASGRKKNASERKIPEALVRNRRRGGQGTCPAKYWSLATVLEKASDQPRPIGFIRKMAMTPNTTSAAVQLRS